MVIMYSTTVLGRLVVQEFVLQNILRVLPNFFRFWNLWIMMCYISSESKTLYVHCRKTKEKISKGFAMFGNLSACFCSFLSWSVDCIQFGWMKVQRILIKTVRYIFFLLLWYTCTSVYQELPNKLNGSILFHLLCFCG